MAMIAKNYFCLILTWQQNTSVLLQDAQLNVLDAFFLLGVIAVNLQKQAVAGIQLVLVNHLPDEAAI